jgi:hypothetical protein
MLFITLQPMCKLDKMLSLEKSTEPEGLFSPHSYLKVRGKLNEYWCMVTPKLSINLGNSPRPHDQCPDQEVQIQEVK